MISRALLETNFHEQTGLYRTLAGLKCSAVTGPVVLGDFLYHYSTQLDAYSVYEVTRTTAVEVEANMIDCDGRLPENTHIGMKVNEATANHGALRTSHLTVWRAVDPAERERIEREGFRPELDYISTLAGYDPGKRPLLNKLFYRPKPDRSFFDKLMHRK